MTVNGGHAQIAWGNDTADQTQRQVELVAPGYEELARVVTKLLADIGELKLAGDEAAEARSNAEAILNEVVKDEPNRSVIRRGLTMIKGLVAPLAAGVRGAVTAESSEAARNLIDALGEAFQ
ncbi:hypothetical protein [Cryobacterium zongtaii]|uniref:hypothetical protein n=1 Tax=Cryobacterium zongtaii TaxID=1259217 RepID=UPI001FAF49DA|nr:hypothetical protein [Cryobacterium zongtaii]